MTQDYKHPIAPPPEELVEQWLDQSKHVTGRNGGCKLISVTNHRLISICAKAAQWGADQANADIERQRQEAADQELDACCEWMNAHSYFSASIRIREDRRPKPPSLKEEALAQLDLLTQKAYARNFAGFQDDAIRRALEQLDD